MTTTYNFASQLAIGPFTGCAISSRTNSKASSNNIKMVSERLGHKSLSTTSVYLHSLEEPVDDFSDLLAKQYGLNAW